MKGQINPKILGASIIGFALVAGAYTISNFGKSSASLPQQATVASIEVAPREAIAVTDNDQNGIEDWRDEFVTTKPVLLTEAVDTYKAPETLTGKLGIDFMESIIEARGFGPFGRSDEEIIADTVNILSKETAHDLYDTPDIIVLEEWSDKDIVNYANIAADIISRNSNSDLEGELAILQDILRDKNESRLEELKKLSEIYRLYRDETLNLPAPAFLAKQHLDLINTYHAIHKDIEAMTLVLDDPAVTLLRLKRYEDDATGLVLSLQNLYLALEPHADLFSANDPALLFVAFSPDFQN